MFEFLFFGRKSKSVRRAVQSAPPSPFAKLRVEQLEDRLTPAAGTYYWIGVDPNGYGYASSWVSDNNEYRPPTHFDTLVYGMSMPVSGSGGVGEPPPPASPPASVVSCIIPAAFQFTGVYLMPPYTGAVTTQDNTIVGTLEIHNGAIEQAGYDNDLFVLTHFQFTGGALNDTPNLGLVHLVGDTANGRGATANLLPPDGGALTVGSTLNVMGLGTAMGGAGMAIFVGNYILKNNADFFIDAHCVAESGKPRQQINQPPPAPPGPTNTTFVEVPPFGGFKGYTNITVAAGGRFDVIGHTKGDARFVVGGVLTIEADKTATLTDPMAPGDSVLVQATGVLRMVAGSKLVANNLVVIDGLFSTLGTGTVKVEAIVRINATGTLVITQTELPDIGGLGADYGRLEVNSLVVNGTVDMSMNAAIDQGVNGELTESGMTDFIYATGSVSFVAGSKLKVKATNASSPVRISRTWDIIETGGNLVGAPPQPEDNRYAVGPSVGPKVIRVTYMGPN